MSVNSQIQRITANIADSYTAVSTKGGTLPASQVSDNLAEAIESIPSGVTIYAPEVLVDAQEDLEAGHIVYTEEQALERVLTLPSTSDKDVQGIAINPAGTLALLYGSSGTRSKLYSIDGEDVTYVTNIITTSGETVNGAAFSPDGKKLVLCGTMTNKIVWYDVNGTTLGTQKTIYRTGTTRWYGSGLCAFSPDGTKLVVAASSAQKGMEIVVYDVTDTAITPAESIYTYTGSSIGVRPTCIAFSPAGDLLVVGLPHADYALVYSVSGGTFTLEGTIPSPTGAANLGKQLDSIQFFPDGSKAIISATLTGKFFEYSISGATFTYVRNIPKADGSSYATTFAYSKVLMKPTGNEIIIAQSSVLSQRYSVNSSGYTATQTVPYEIKTGYFLPDGRHFLDDIYLYKYPQSDNLLGYATKQGTTTGAGIAKTDIDTGDSGTVYQVWP